MKLRLNRIFLLFLAGALLTLTGCAQAVDHSIAGAIKSSLPNAIGPAQYYVVTVNSNPIDAAQGRVKQVDIIGKEVSLSAQLLIDQLTIEADDVQANVQTRKVTKVGHVSFEAKIGQDGIDHYLAALPNDSPQRKEGLRVTLNESTITAQINCRVAGISVPASVTGTFEVSAADDKHIDFIPDSGSLSIIPIPRFALDFALRQINPVIDLTNSNVPVSVDDVTVQANVLQLSGTANLQQGLVQN